MLGFGMHKKECKGTGKRFSYRFGFNGKEQDNEVYNGSIAFEARIYDARLGRFLSTDPWEYKYAWQSTYVYFKNSPISTLDFLGKGGGDDEELPAPKEGTNDQSLKEVVVKAKRLTVEEKAARGYAVYPQPAPSTVAPWMDIAKKEMGVYERDKENGGYDRVKEYYKKGAGQGGLHPINNAWCSSFCNWVMMETNEQKGTNFSVIPPNGHTNNPALAINWVNKKRYPGGTIVKPLNKPPYGSILVMKKNESYEGHAAFIVNYEEKTKGSHTFTLLGGNQGHKVQLATYTFEEVKGKLVYKSKYTLLGFVLPKEYNFDSSQIFFNYDNAEGKETSTR